MSIVKSDAIPALLNFKPSRQGRLDQRNLWGYAPHTRGSFLRGQKRTKKGHPVIIFIRPVSRLLGKIIQTPPIALLRP